MFMASAVALHLMPKNGAGLAIGGGLQKHGSATIAEQNTCACHACLPSSSPSDDDLSGASQAAPAEARRT